jgi:hypothetical protein
MPATNVDGISLAGGSSLRRDGIGEWVAVAAVADMATFLRIMVGGVMVE